MTQNELLKLAASLEGAALSACEFLAVDPSCPMTLSSPFGTLYFARWQLLAERIMQNVSLALPATQREEFKAMAAEAIDPKSRVLH